MKYGGMMVSWRAPRIIASGCVLKLNDHEQLMPILSYNHLGKKNFNCVEYTYNDAIKDAIPSYEGDFNALLAS